MGQSDSCERTTIGKLLTKEGLYKHPDVGHYERRLVQVEAKIFLVDRKDAGMLSIGKHIGEKRVKLHIRKRLFLNGGSFGISFKKLRPVFTTRFFMNTCTARCFFLGAAIGFAAGAFDRFLFLAATPGLKEK
ncbi:MAG: hypothetical protein KF852_08030 [Saprospiraceae bacterium]|nr:hypothetical protein [Saprospiraceae bacterium]